MRRPPDEWNSESGAKARLFHAVSEAHLSRIIKVDLKAEMFCYEVDEHAQTLAEMMDGKRLLVTNTPDQAPGDIVARYKSLADIERGFKVLMRMRLKAADAGLSPERALERLRRIQYHRIQIDAANPVSGVSTIQNEQTEILRALNVKKPAAHQQLALL